MKYTDDFSPILLNAGLASLNTAWNYKNVHSPFARIYLVEDGRASLLFADGRVQELIPGNLYFIQPYTTHGYQCDKTCKLYYIHIFEHGNKNVSLFEDFIFPLRAEATQLDYALVIQLLQVNPDRELKQYDPRFYDNISTIMKCIETNASVPHYQNLETTGILLQLFSRFMALATNKFTQTDDRILRVVRYVRNNIDAGIGMQDMLKISYMSKDHFIKVFKKNIGSTPIRYVIQKKMEKAQLLLATTNLPVKDIAFGLSFDNVCYFNRLFKKAIGLSPLAYRQSVRLE